MNITANLTSDRPPKQRTRSHRVSYESPAAVKSEFQHTYQRAGRRRTYLSPPAAAGPRRPSGRRRAAVRPAAGRRDARLHVKNYSSKGSEDARANAAGVGDQLRTHRPDHAVDASWKRPLLALEMAAWASGDVAGPIHHSNLGQNYVSLVFTDQPPNSARHHRWPASAKATTKGWCPGKRVMLPASRCYVYRRSTPDGRSRFGGRATARERQLDVARALAAIGMVVELGARVPSGFVRAQA